MAKLVLIKIISQRKLANKNKNILFFSWLVLRIGQTREKAWVPGRDFLA
jgi:hypothetical protein